MSFYEQLCLLNDEDLPEIKWLETILDEMKPEREEVLSFIVKLESEIAERKHKLVELELEVRKQNRRIEFAIDCKDCLFKYSSNKFSKQQTRPAVPPRSDSIKKQKADASNSFDDESNYLRLSDCYSSRMEAAKSALMSEGIPLGPFSGPSPTFQTRKPLKNATGIQNTPIRRHTLDEEKMKKHALDRAEVAQQPLKPSTSSSIPNRAAIVPPSSYVNVDNIQESKSSERNSCASPHSELAMIDEQFGFLDEELSTPNSEISSHRGTPTVEVAAGPSDTEQMDKMTELRRSLIAGFVADQRDYVNIMETVVKYSRAIQTTLSSPKPDVISAGDFNIIFGLIPKIYEIEKLLIDSLESKLKNWSPNEPLFAPLVGEKYSLRMSLYAQYLRDYPVILETASRCLKESPKFNETCGQIIVQERKQGKVKRRLEDIFILPIVRLQATGLALERIIEATPPSHPDHDVLIALRQKLRTSLDSPTSVPVPDGHNERLADQKRHVLRPAVPIVEWVTEPTSKLTTLTVDSIRKLRYTFLFTDVFVACKRKSIRNNRFQFEAVWWFQVSDIKLEDLPPAKVEQTVKTKLEELSHQILMIRRELQNSARSHNQTHIQENRKKLQQLEEAWLVAAPLVPLRLYNAAEPTRNQNVSMIATSNDSKLLLFLSDFELGDCRRALHACQKRLMSSSSSPSHFTKEFLTCLCNEVADKVGISNASSQPRLHGALGGNLPYLPLNQPEHRGSVLSISDGHGMAASGSSASGSPSGGDMTPGLHEIGSMGTHQLSGQLMVTVHELNGLATAKACSVVLYVDCFGHFQIQAQTRLSKSDLAPQWNDEFELDLNNSSTMRVVCYSREADGRDIIVGQSALQLTPDWLGKPFVVQPIGLLAASSIDPHLALTLTIRFRPPHMTIRRRGAFSNVKKSFGVVFGSPIAEVASRDNNESSIPRLVTECVRRIEAADGLDQEGLYRISGLVGEVKRVKAAFDKDITTAREQLHMADVNVVAGVLKSYFRELPDPLFTEAASQDCLRLVAENRDVTLNDGDVQRQAAAIFDSLPKANRKTAFFLLQHLNRVAEKSNKNLMTAENLARIWGPTLLSPPSGAGPAMSASSIYLQGQVLLIFLNIVSSGYKPSD